MRATAPSPTGFVHFVSSGPGDPELLTVRAINRLQQAEVVLFDDLSAGAILSHVSPDADLIGVGKRAGRASPRQDHVSRLLVDYASAGKRVVRLKSGDSGIFGRLEEEIEALQQAGIAYEIVPGVTAASAAASALGIPLTRRETARRIQFVTGHDTSGGLPDGLNITALADPAATTVVYMARRTFPALAARLLEAGLPASTPAALAEGVGTADQQLWRGDISGLIALLDGAKRAVPGVPEPPALILYGALMTASAQGDKPCGS